VLRVVMQQHAEKVQIVGYINTNKSICYLSMVWLGVTRPWIYSRQEQEFSASTQNYTGGF